MESVAASGVISLQFSTAPQPKINRLWDLLEEVSPVCRTFWIATGWGAWRGDEQVQANQVSVISLVSAELLPDCVSRQPSWNHPSPPHPCITLLGGGRFRLKHQPSHTHPGRVRQLHCFRLKVAQREHGTWPCVPDYTVNSKHKAAYAEHTRPLPHINKPPKPANISN